MDLRSRVRGLIAFCLSSNERQAEISFPFYRLEVFIVPRARSSV